MQSDHEAEREFADEFEKEHDGEMADLSPATFRFAAALLAGLALIALVGVL